MRLITEICESYQEVIIGFAWFSINSTHHENDQQLYAKLILRLHNRDVDAVKKT